MAKNSADNRGMKKIIMLVGVVCGFTSCSTVAPFQSASAGHVGCMSNEVAISDQTSSMNGTWEWRASCHDKKFVCSSVPTGSAFGGLKASCTEEARTPANKSN